MTLLRPFKKESNITDRINMSKWGSVIETDMHKGEILRSYQQTYDCISSILK